MAKTTNKNIHRLINAATQVIPVEQSFVADLLTSIERHELENSRKPSKSYKPSSMNCLRNMYFQITGEPQDGERSSACLIGINESGTDRHERIQTAIIAMKDLVDCEYLDVETYIKDNNLTHLEVVSKKGIETKLYYSALNLTFLCDGIIKYKGKYYILEIKTETMYNFQMRDAIAPEHIVQGTSYSCSFEIDEVLYLYENRDNCAKKAYILKVTPEMKQELVLSRIEECDGYVSRLIPPPKPLDVRKKTCEYCKYKKACRKAGK